MRKLFAAGAMAALMTTGGIGLAQAKGPDPTGPAKYGLCNAYSHNSDQAKQHGQAFQNLEQAADQAGNQDGTGTPDEVASFCSGATPGGK